MSDPIRSFEDLECWKVERELREFVALEVVPLHPREEKLRLGAQILEGARLVAANIAEWYGRFHYLDNSKFCSNARGSYAEVLDYLITASDENLIADHVLQVGRAKVDLTLKLINGYRAYLRRVA